MASTIPATETPAMPPPSYESTFMQPTLSLSYTSRSLADGESTLHATTTKDSTGLTTSAPAYAASSYYVPSIRDDPELQRYTTKLTARERLHALVSRRKLMTYLYISLAALCLCIVVASVVLGFTLK
ncbi:hypothetical protein POJ06DRAFT_298665 [Lipomyces tetrasporus]|uniref:Uncharacterized protein n=1 Tax=Lipomyces tetrasporus TaxID=54092 RepID=A0AAD7QZG1_9ASCO|nr:uncharacterized protein POJ06DRAFT_298665 [Lipomyces tetrasporus]KAJ8104314.1 hypothetical protein POJ06DRAFT_298665 [Lipomyces tetrasporus]